MANRAAVGSSGLRIAQAALQTGLSTKTIRYYDEVGLIPHLRRSGSGFASNGYRVFSETDIERLKFTKRAKLLGLSLKQILDLLSVLEHAPARQMRPHLEALLTEKLHEIDERRKQLEMLRADLERIHRNLIETAGTAQKSCCDPFCGPETCGGESAVVKVLRGQAREGLGHG